MSYFDDLINQPLPSQNKRSLQDIDDVFNESADDMEALLADSMDDFEEDEDDEGYDNDDDDDDYDFDDDEDDELEKELEDLDTDIDDDIDDYDDYDDEDDLSVHLDADTKYRTPTSVLDPTPAEPLDEEDGEEADRALNLTATPILVDSTLTESECVSEMESGEFNILVNEGFMLESDVADLASEIGDEASIFMEGAFAAPGKAFKLTKAARFKQLYALSLNIEARAHNDPFYPKMQKAYKIERTIKKGWEKRYGALAKKRAIRYLRRLAKSKSGIAQKIVQRITKKPVG